MKRRGLTLCVEAGLLMEEAVWAEIRGARPGIGGRVRKRVLEAGERLRSLTASCDWIPRPRERLKTALASPMSVDETLDALERDTRDLEGADVAHRARAAPA